MLGANQMGVTNGEKMNLQVGGPTNTIVLTENRTGVTLIMDLTLYQLGHASTTGKWGDGKNTRMFSLFMFKLRLVQAEYRSKTMGPHFTKTQRANICRYGIHT